MSTEIRVLVLEDFAPDAEIMMHELRRAGFKPLWQRVENERDFRRLLEANWDIILADYSLPQFNATSALEILHDLRLHIPVIIISGTISEEAALSCIRMGAADYLLKDRLSRLGPAVQHILEEKELRQEQDRTKAALTQSEERFYRLADNATDMMLRIGLEGGLSVQYINPAVESMLGYTTDELRKQPSLLVDTVHPDDRTTLLSILQDQVRDSQSAALRWQHRDGRWIWIDIKHTDIRDEQGRLTAIEAVGRDITARVHAEQALEQANEELEQRVRERTAELETANAQLTEANQKNRAILESITDAFLAVNREFIITYANGTAAELFNYSVEHMRGMNLWDVFPEARGTVFQEEYNRSLDLNQPRKFEAQYPRLRKWLAVSCYPSAEGLSIFLDDVTHRREILEQLRESEERFRQIADNVSEILYMIDPIEQQVLYISPSFDDVFGISRAEIYNNPKALLQYLHPDDSEGVMKNWPLRRVEHYDWEARIVRPDGEVRWMHDRAFPVKDESGTLIRIVGIAEDVTAEKRYVEELQHLNESLEQRVAQRTLYLDLLKTVSQIANQSDSAEEALQQTLEVVCKAVDWSVGHVFLTDPATHDIRDSRIWYTADPDAFQELKRVTLDYSPPENGMVGKVVKTGAPVWIKDVRAMDFRRAAPGADLGVRSAVAFPVLIEKEVVAVLEFFCETDFKLPPQLMEVMTNVGTQVGRAMERQRLQQQLTEAVMREQRRLGFELHEGVGQQLAGLAMSIRTLQTQLNRQNLPQAEEARNAADQLREAVVRVRAVARGLFPVAVDAEGMRAALVDLAQQTEARYGVQCTCHIDDSARLTDNDAAIELYRIAQEAINNAILKGKVRHVEITFCANDMDFFLKIHDDGVTDGANSRRGIGLFIMQHRARIIHATLDARTEKGKGYSVICKRGGTARNDER